MTKTPETIAIIGAGFVGLSTAALLSNCGYTVHLLDVDKQRLDAIRNGKSFFYEEGIDVLIAKAVSAGTLLPGDDYTAAIPDSSIIFSCVGTPDKADGSSNLQYVFEAAETSAKLMKPGTVYVQKSTVPVGTGNQVLKRIHMHQPDCAYVSNPEFLREGTALFDTLFFDRVVVGGEDSTAKRRVIELYKSIALQRDKLVRLAKIKTGNTDGQYIETTLNGAELVKVTANAFLALKISFANNIAMLADKADADVVSIMDAVGADRRIGRAFLNAGRGYGGGCFPKDVSGLIKSAESYGVDMPIMKAATAINEAMPGYIVMKLEATAGKLTKRRIAVLGLSFKAGTSDARKSPGVAIANFLAKSGAHVTAYDPQANAEARPTLAPNIELASSIDTAVSEADIIMLTTDWPELTDYASWRKSTKATIIMDCVNALDPQQCRDDKRTYLGVGR